MNSQLAQFDKERLASMLAGMNEAPAIYQPSPFWDALLRSHSEKLEKWGIENFKRTVNTQYFNWLAIGIIAHQLFPALIQWLRRPSFAFQHAEFRDYDQPQGEGIAHMNVLQALLYRFYVVQLKKIVATADTLDLFSSVDEPQLGNPWQVRLNESWVSQDLCNSIHEFYSAGYDQWKIMPRLEIAELGAGYGRLAYVFLEAIPKCTYTIIDIPPALFVSEAYLTRLYGEESVFRYRHFETFASIASEFNRARIRFLMAHQIEMLPSKQFDLMINVSSLHEMTMAQIENYFRAFDRLVRHWCYIKQWKKSRATSNDCIIKELEYPVPSTWETVFHRRHPIQRWFFDALYRLP